MERTYTEIKEEATNLGIEFRSNLGAVKLQTKIDEYYENESADASEVSVDTEEEIEDEAQGKLTPVAVKTVVKKKLTDEEVHRLTIAKLKKEMVKTKVVRVNMVDKRENSEVTSYFVQNGVVGRHIPLDVPIELEQCLVDQLRRTKVPTHVKDLYGNSSTKLVKKFFIEDIK